MVFEFRRFPAVPKNISEITESDIRIRILGRVIDKADGVIVVDDGTGKAEIVSDAEADINDTVRVFTRVLPLESGYELRAEIVQNMNKLDMELYRKIFAD